MRNFTKNIRFQLITAILSVLVCFIALSSATYAWYVSNNTVTASTSSIAAQANGFMLQIVNYGYTLDHGSDQALYTSTVGHKISPTSTEDAKVWWVPDRWTAQLKVETYMKPTWDLDSEGNQIKGQYTVGDETYYTYVVGEYTLYTLTNTGICDVFLDGSAEGGAIQVTVKDENDNDIIVKDKVAASMRIGITVGDGDSEKLVLVYSPTDETGMGNDVNATEGWSVVKDETHTKSAPYPYVSGNNYTYIKDGVTYNYGVTRSGHDYTKGENTVALTEANYSGVPMRVYIWLEGTDADCVSSIVDGDNRVFAVKVNLAGVAK